MSQHYFYVYKLNKDGERYIGFGVTKHMQGRHYDHMRTFNASGVICEDYRYKECISKKAALALENRLKSEFFGEGLDILGFKTESLPVARVDKFKEIVSTFDLLDVKYAEPTKTERVFDMQEGIKFDLETITDLDIDALQILKMDKQRAFEIIKEHLQSKQVDEEPQKQPDGLLDFALDEMSRMDRCRNRQRFGLDEITELDHKAIQILMKDKKLAFDLIKSSESFSTEFDRLETLMLSDGGREVSRRTDWRDRKQFDLDSVGKKDAVVLYLIKHNKPEALKLILSYLKSSP